MILINMNKRTTMTQQGSHYIELDEHTNCRVFEITSLKPCNGELNRFKYANVSSTHFILTAHSHLTLLERFLTT